MSIGSIFKSAFPFISAAASLGGPLGTMAANAVGSALNITAPKNANDIADAIAVATSKDPDAMLKLKEAEEGFQLQMQKLGFDDAEKIAELETSDRANARARQIAVKDATPAILAVAITLGFFGLLTLFAFHDVPAAAHDILLTMIGALGAAWSSVVAFYFGSSLGSQSKDATIHAAVANSGIATGSRQITFHD